MQDAISRLYIGEVEAAQRYGMSRAWFQRKRWSGDGPTYVKVGSRILYPLGQTDEWFAQREQRHSSERREGK